MVFKSITLSDEGRLTAHAVGHANEVVTAFYKLGLMLFGNRGAWRIVEVQGAIKDSEPLESNMQWSLYAKLKDVKEADDVVNDSTAGS